MRAASLLVALTLASSLVSIPVTALAEEASSVSRVTSEAPIAAPGEVAEARAQIDATLAQMRAISLRVREALRATRKRGTKAQITCVDEALSRSDVALRRGRELGDTILTAYGRGDVDAARGSRGRLFELREYQRQAAMTAASCSPGANSLAVTNATTVKLVVDPSR